MRKPVRVGTRLRKPVSFYNSAFWKMLRAEALRRDGYRCTVPGCPETEATSTLHVDHIRTRPDVPHATAHDCLSNLRTLCDYHDKQIKEDRDGKRRNGGIPTPRGCRHDGTPNDPNHHWRRGAAR